MNDLKTDFHLDLEEMENLEGDTDACGEIFDFELD